MNRIVLLMSLIILNIPSLFSGWPWPDCKDEYLPKHLSVDNLPEWMDRSVMEELSPFFQTGISLSKLNKFYDESEHVWNYNSLNLVRFRIKNNIVYLDKKFGDNLRVDRYEMALKILCQLVGLPDTTFLISISDCLDQEYEVPIFVMAKDHYFKSHILIPDFEAVGACYQVLQNRDITQFVIPWESKKPILVWRGGSGQGIVTPENYQSLSRFILCDLSMQYPQLIDAKFTLWGHEHLKMMPNLIKYEAKIWHSYEDQLKYKFHIILDGNSCAYTASGWKFFTNSLIFKTDSPAIQWYYSELKPFVHFIPLKPKLEDLLEKLEWCRQHDSDVKVIANNARQFALENLTVESNLRYLYKVLIEYAKLVKD